MGTNVVDLSTTTQSEGTCHINVSLEIPEHDISFVERLMERIRLNMPEYLMRQDDFFDKKK